MRVPKSTPFVKLLRITLVAVLPATYFLKLGIPYHSIVTNLTFWVFLLAYFLCICQMMVLGKGMQIYTTDIALFVFAIYIFASTLWSSSSLIGLRKAMEFIFITLSIIYFVRFLIRDENEVKQVIKISVFIATLLAAYNLYSLFSADIGQLNRITLGRTTPVAMGLFCSIHAYGSLYFLSNRGENRRAAKMYYGLSLVVLVLSLVLSGSRASILGFLVAGFWLFLRSGRKREFVVALVVVAGFLFVLNRSVPILDYQKHRFGGIVTKDEAVEVRISVYGECIEIIKENPFFGSGIGSNPEGYAHNIFLEIGSENGLVGLGLMFVICLVLNSVREKIRKERTYHLIMGMFVISFVVSLFSYSYSFNRYLFFSMGLILVVYHVRRGKGVTACGYGNNSILK